MLRTTEELFQKFFPSNSQKLILNNIYALFCLAFSNKDMISLQEFIRLMFAHLKSLSNTTQRFSIRMRLLLPIEKQNEL
jgi:hypothetical protein